MPADLTTSYPFDPTGKKVTNKIPGEQHALTSANYRDFHFIVPKHGPFFADSVRVTYRDTQGVLRSMVPGVDFQFSHWFVSASRACASPLYGSISFYDLNLVGTITVEYQTVGGIWTQDSAKIAQILADRLHNPRTTAWEQVVDMPVAFPVIDHDWDLKDLVGMSDVTVKLSAIATAIRSNMIDGLAAHKAARNPHGTTAADLNAYNKQQIDLMFAQVNARIDNL